MYGMKGKNPVMCDICRRKSCLYPSPCKNLDRSHARVLDMYHRVMKTKGIRHAYIGSGIRYDLFLSESGYVDDTGLTSQGKGYARSRRRLSASSRNQVQANSSKLT